MRRLSGGLLTILVTLPVVLLLSTCGPPAMAANAPTYGEVHRPPEDDALQPNVCPSPYEPFTRSRPSGPECNTLTSEESGMNWDFSNRKSPPLEWFKDLQIHETLHEYEFPRIFTFRLAGPERYDQRSTWIAVWIESLPDGKERYLANFIEDQTLRDLRANKLEVRLVISQSLTTVLDLNITDEGVEFVTAVFYPYRELEIETMVGMEFLDADVLPPREYNTVFRQFEQLGVCLHHINNRLLDYKLMRDEKGQAFTPEEADWFNKTRDTLASAERYTRDCGEELFPTKTSITPT